MKKKLHQCFDRQLFWACLSFYFLIWCDFDGIWWDFASLQALSKKPQVGKFCIATATQIQIPELQVFLYGKWTQNSTFPTLQPCQFVACFTHGQSSASSKSSEVGNQNVLLLMAYGRNTTRCINVALTCVNIMSELNPKSESESISGPSRYPVRSNASHSLE